MKKKFSKLQFQSPNFKDYSGAVTPLEKLMLFLSNLSGPEGQAQHDADSSEQRSRTEESGMPALPLAALPSRPTDAPL